MEIWASYVERPNKTLHRYRLGSRDVAEATSIQWRHMYAPLRSASTLKFRWMIATQWHPPRFRGGSMHRSNTDDHYPPFKILLRYCEDIAASKGFGITDSSDHQNNWLKLLQDPCGVGRLTTVAMSSPQILKPATSDWLIHDAWSRTLLLISCYIFRHFYRGHWSPMSAASLHEWHTSYKDQWESDVPT